MKKTVFVIIAVLVISSQAVPQVWARAKKTKPEHGVSEKSRKLSAKKAKEILVQKRADLEGTEWDVEMKLPSGEKKSEDRLLFKEKQFLSEGFALQGLKPADYSLSMKDDGAIIFETMQPGEDGGMVFWRGEFSPDSTALRGIVSQVSADQKATDLYFSGVRVKENKH